MKHNRKPRSKPTYIRSINLQKRAYNINGKQGVSSINSAGKTGQPHAKEFNWATILYHTKNK